MKTLLCFKDALEKNTTEKSDYAFQILINGKMFISDDGVCCFPTATHAINAVKNSAWWGVILEHVNDCAEYFGQSWNPEFYTDFESKIWRNMIDDEYIQIRVMKEISVV